MGQPQEAISHLKLTGQFLSMEMGNPESTRETTNSQGELFGHWSYHSEKHNTACAPKKACKINSLFVLFGVFMQGKCFQRRIKLPHTKEDAWSMHSQDSEDYKNTHKIRIVNRLEGEKQRVNSQLKTLSLFFPIQVLAPMQAVSLYWNTGFSWKS